MIIIAAKKRRREAVDHFDPGKPHKHVSSPVSDVQRILGAPATSQWKPTPVGDALSLVGEYAEEESD